MRLPPGRTAAMLTLAAVLVGTACAREPASAAGPVPLQAATPTPVPDHSAFVAAVDGSDAIRLPLSSAGFSGGDEIFVCTAEFFAPRPPGDVLPLLITWPVAALPDAYTEVRLAG